MMPYPNEHSARVRAQVGFERIRRQNRAVSFQGKSRKLGVNLGTRPNGKTLVQSYRFPTADWSEGEARAYANAHDGKMFEPATDGNGGGTVPDSGVE